MIRILPTEWYSKKTKERFLEEVDSKLQFSVEYFIQYIFAAIISSLGLIIGSNEVVIGGMLISPLFWPIIGLATGLITTRRHILEKSINLLIQSVALALIIAALFAFILPVNEISDEIKSRINPTIIDLLIALASSIVGVFLTYSPKTSASIAGVAVSLALLPPVCVAGIGLALQLSIVFWGGMLLFFANFAAMVFFGMFTLYLLGFRPHYKAEEERWTLGIIISSIFLIAISIPLTIFFIQSINQQNIKEDVDRILKQEIEKIDTDAQLDKLSIFFNNVSQSDIVEIETTIYLPEGKYITTSQKEELTRTISTSLGKPVEIYLNLVNTLGLRNNIDEQNKQLKQNVNIELQKLLEEVNSSIEIQNFEIYLPAEADTENVVLINSIVLKSESATLPRDLEIDIANSLSEIFPFEFIVHLEYLNIYDVNRINSIEELTTVVQNVVEENLVVINGGRIQMLGLEYPNEYDKRILDVNITLNVLPNTDIPQIWKQNLQNLLVAETGKDINLNVIYLEYNTI